MFQTKTFRKKTLLFKLSQKVKERYPYASDNEIKLAFNGLFIYFQICRQYHLENTPIPSFIIDEIWRDFIIETNDYAIFCQEYLKGFFHYVPFDTEKSLDIKTPFSAEHFLSMLENKQHKFLVTDLELLANIDNIFMTKEKIKEKESMFKNKNLSSSIIEIIKKIR